MGHHGVLRSAGPYFVGGCFFKYPDTVDATVTVTTEHPPVWIVAKGSGKLKELYRHDRDSVRAGDIIAVLDNPAVTADVLALKEELAAFTVTDSCVRAVRFPENGHWEAYRRLMPRF